MVAFYPDRPGSLEVARGLADGGCAYLEVQFPFSDPTADGPDIQRACSAALEAGLHRRRRLRAHRRDLPLREAPVFLMSYANLLFTRGVRRFLADAASRGVRGVIVPDLPADYDEGLFEEAAEAGLAAVPVLSPSMTGCAALAHVFAAGGVPVRDAANRNHRTSHRGGRSRARVSFPCSTRRSRGENPRRFRHLLTRTGQGLLSPRTRDGCGKRPGARGCRGWRRARGCPQEGCRPGRPVSCPARGTRSYFAPSRVRIRYTRPRQKRSRAASTSITANGMGRYRKTPAAARAAPRLIACRRDRE